MRWLAALFLCALVAAPGLGAGRDLSDLGSDFAEARRRARARLIRAGPEIEPILIERYRRANYLARAEILEILAARKCCEAIPLVIADLGTVSRSVREAQARFLVALGGPGRKALDGILAGDDRRRVAWAREVLGLMVRVTVERKILSETLGPNLHYAGQYAELLTDRGLAADVLLEMAANARGGYRFVVPVDHVVGFDEIRSAAVDALSDVARRSDLPRLEALLERTRQEMRSAPDEVTARSAERVMEGVCYVLHGLGEIEPAEALARDLWDRFHGLGFHWDLDAHEAQFSLALTLTRMGRHRQAKRVYEDILADGRFYARLNHANAAYNLACLLSLMGRIEDAYDALVSAVRHDPLAVNPSMEDGDLAPVRKAYPDLEQRLMAVAPPLPGDEEPEDASDD